MTAKEIKQLIAKGESTTVQFKLRIDNAYKAGVEMVAFSNRLGGTLVISVDDKTGVINGLSFQEIQACNALLANAATENVKPAISIESETVETEFGNIIMVTIPQGKDKPYRDNKGIIWTKNGSDKRKLTSNIELRTLMQESGSMAADKEVVENSSLKDISIPTLKRFLFEKYTDKCSQAGIERSGLEDTELKEIVEAIDHNFTIEKLLANISLMTPKGELSLAGLLLLGKSIQHFHPVFTVQCVSFVGNSMATNEFRDKLIGNEMDGNLLHQYNSALSFVRRNLRSVQVEKGFNSIPRLEIPIDVFVELIVNALLHRSYYNLSAIRIFIFDNRIEIHSPGLLPDSVTEESIRSGISKPRNQLLFDNAKFLLPYTGIGSGVLRAMRSYPNISLENNVVTDEFVATIMREEDVEENDTDNVGDNGVDGIGSGIDNGTDGIDNGIEAEILALIKTDKNISKKNISKKLGIGTTTVSRYIDSLKTKGIVERIGPDRGGHWKIK